MGLHKILWLSSKGTIQTYNYNTVTPKILFSRIKEEAIKERASKLKPYLNLQSLLLDQKGVSYSQLLNKKITTLAY